MQPEVTVVGGGLAGSEAAWQLAGRGLVVRLSEMRPERTTGAHATGDLAELVCSNSLGSQLPDRASGILLSELRRLGSLLVECADRTAIPAGGALAVDRRAFAELVTQRLHSDPRIHIERTEVEQVPDGPVVIASGPLTSEALSQALRALTGSEHLYFFDALSPIVYADSLDFSVVFRASRYERGVEETGDYLNAPLNAEEYAHFVRALRSAERIPLRTFETAIEHGVRAGPDRFFEACLPVEVLAERGEMALAFGPMRPVGLRDPRTGEQPFAVVQLRQDNLAGSLHNLVGFQTNLTYTEQDRVLRMIPGLGRARFARFGQMHRNTFIHSPSQLRPTLQHRLRADLLFAGQITGVEGYLGNIATGLLAGVNLSRIVQGQDPIALPETTMLGALCRYITSAEGKTFQPMKASIGLLPPFGDGVRRTRRQRAQEHARRSQEALESALIQAGAETMRIATRCASVPSVNHTAYGSG